jgi:hypothetical protein
VDAWSRLRPALAELALAFAGMLLGIGALIGLDALGLAATGGPQGRLYSYVWGPGMTAVAALFYRWASRALDGGEARVDPASLPPPTMAVGMQITIVAAGIAAALVGSFVLGELVGLLGFPVEEQKAILDIVGSAKGRGAYFELIVLGASAIVLAPAAEEWMFRGLLFKRLLQVSGRPEAYFLSATAFAAIHTNPAGFIVYTWLGVCFAYTYHRTGRLWTAVAVHMGNNAFAFALLMG